MQRHTPDRYTNPLILILLAAACYTFFFHQLGGVGFIGPDEPRYASIAREMYRSGDYVTPRLLGSPWFEKPVLLYWGSALGYALFGEGEFGARFPSALGATLSVFAMYYVTLRLWSRKAAIWAALILASSIGFFAFAHAATTDMLLTTTLTLAMAAFLIGYNETGSARRWWFYAFYFCLGLGVLAKGPVALLLPALSLGAYALLRGQFNEWKAWHPEGILISLAVAAPWYIAVTWANGYDFIEVFFINQNFARFTSTVHGHERPFYFYIPALLMLTFPWTFLLIPAIRRGLDRSGQFLLLWAVVPLVFFSLSGSKLPGYILPSVPPLVMLSAREVANGTSRAFRIAVFIEAGALLFIGVALGFFGQMLHVDAHVNGKVIAGLTFTFAALLVPIAIWTKPSILALCNFAIVAAAVVVATNFVLPRFDVSDTMRPWSKALPTLLPADETVFLYRPSRWVEYGMQFYRQENAKGVFSPEELVELVRSRSKVFLITSQSLEDLSKIRGVDMHVVEMIGNHTALWVRYVD
jgi:4-amino-4-deoxy-L-arabinose transferase-like glycosyltransferase